MEEEYYEDAPAKIQRMSSFFDNDALERKEILQRAIHAYMEKSNMHDYVSNTTHCYSMSDAFSTTDTYWIQNVQGERFEETFTRGVLYRPEIVNEMKQLVDTCLNQKDDAVGIMIQGPRGIGKSHSMVNLVRALLYNSDGKYLVTFIPNCDEWSYSGDLYKAICSSFGCTTRELGVNHTGSGVAEKKTLLGEFIEMIDSILAKKGMKWVFAFDQICELFDQPECKELKHVGALPFPFMAIKGVMKPGRITSIISTCNKLPYRNFHPGFVEYNHPCSMSTDEINILYPEVTKLSEQDRNKAHEVTGCVPLQVTNLISSDLSFETYQGDALDSILDTLYELHRKYSPEIFQGITKSVVACLLSIDGNDFNYDCRYTIKSRQGTKYHYDALFPMVLIAYRRYFWDSILRLFKLNEGPMLLACKNKNVTNEAYSQMFNLIVIHRCSSHINVELDLAWGFPRLISCTLVKTIGDCCLPSVLKENGMYVPLHSDFPVIHLIWKCGKSVCGVQLHVATHKGTVESFERLCSEAGWFEKFEHVYLLYLSPTKQIANIVQKHVCQHHGRIIVAATSIHNVSCLADLQWPEVSYTY